MLQIMMVIQHHLLLKLTSRLDKNVGYSEKMNNTENSPKNTNLKIAMVIVIIILLLVAMFILNKPGTLTVNEFYDDQIDKNGDGIINQTDFPSGWNSYNVGDKIVIRDMVDRTMYEANQTIIFLVEYSGNYAAGGRSQVSVVVLGDMRNTYEEGSYITVESEMKEYLEGNIYPGRWTLVD